MGESTEPGDESALAHLAQPDHWTFLLALALVAANVVVHSRAVSAVAALLLVAALVYDLYEFYGTDG